MDILTQPCSTVTQSTHREPDDTDARTPPRRYGSPQHRNSLQRQAADNKGTVEVDDETTWRAAPELDGEAPVEIPYDADMCDRYLSSWAYVLAVHDLQDELIDPEYGRQYREMRAEELLDGAGGKLRFLLERPDGSIAGTCPDPAATAAAMRRAAHRSTSANPPSWRAVRPSPTSDPRASPDS